jgi:tetratricopeptide (TPR) repeat protein
MIMKLAGIGYGIVIVGFLMSSATMAASYSDLLKEGDNFLYAEEIEKSMEAYAEAEKKADNQTEKALAISKQAYVLAYKKKDYKEALAMANRALELKNVKPIGRVTALQVRGKCLLEKEEDYEAAEEALKEAAALEGVDWSKAVIYLTLGDSYRAQGKHKPAIEAYEQVSKYADTDDIFMLSVAKLNIGTVYQYGLRQPDKALEAYNQAEEMNPDLEKEIKGHKSSLAFR